jgi:hypothetical protein
LNTLERLRFIRSGIAASAFVHLSILAVVLIFAEVHPFESVTAEPITVDIVSPEEAPPAPQKDQPPVKKEELPLLPKFQLTDSFDIPAKSAPAAQTASTAPQAAVSPQQAGATPQPKQSGTTPPQKQAAATPPQRQAALSTPLADQPQAAAALPQLPASAAPAYTPPEPDVTVKYHVLLGLPPELPQGQPRAKPGDGFDAEASEKADVASSLVAEFRNHLRTCSKLPASIAASDKLRIKLRVFMTPQGKMAAEPTVIEGTPSLKALDLTQGAVDALKACQPYTMLPMDRYGEWKVLDLSFTPQDFTGG